MIFYVFSIFYGGNEKVQWMKIDKKTFLEDNEGTDMARKNMKMARNGVTPNT